MIGSGAPRTIIRFTGLSDKNHFSPDRIKGSSMSRCEWAGGDASRSLSQVSIAISRVLFLCCFCNGQHMKGIRVCVRRKVSAPGSFRLRSPSCQNRAPQCFYLQLRWAVYNDLLFCKHEGSSEETVVTTGRSSSCWLQRRYKRHQFKYINILSLDDQVCKENEMGWSGSCVDKTTEPADSFWKLLSFVVSTVSLRSSPWSYVNQSRTRAVLHLPQQPVPLKRRLWLS